MATCLIHNTLQQLTRMTVAGAMDLEYRYTAGQNNGRISSRKDYISGEEVTYQYDSLNRLITAVTTGPEWGQSFTFDGFGNLLNETVTKGSAPSLSVNVDGTTNRITTSGYSYDSKEPGDRREEPWDRGTRGQTERFRRPVRGEPA